MSEKIFNELKKIIGEDRIFTDEQIILDSTKDYIGFRQYERADGVYNVPRGGCVVRVKDTDQVSSVLKYLNENKINIMPRTGGSSVTMSIEPEEGAVILDGSDMNKIIEVNKEDMTVTALCGTPLEYLENHLNKIGLTTGHYPQSIPLAHVGGLVATRSSGQFSTLYGNIEDMVTGLEAVLPDGEIIRIKNNPRRAVGPDLRQIFIGSEGIFGYITEVSLKLHKYQPENYWMNAYAIESMDEGLKIIREIMTEGYKPAVVRLHDEYEVANLFGGIAPEGHGMLLFLADGPKAITEVTGNAIDNIVQKYDGVVDMGSKPVESWLITRNDVSATMDEPTYYKLGLIADTCEISAPWSEIGKIYNSVIERLNSEIENLILAGGHSSHSYLQGTNIYFQFAVIPKDGSKTAREDYMSVVQIIMEETLKRNGSISHHHGSGKYRTPWMDQEHGSSYTLLKTLKKAIDPNGIMNKGILIQE